MISRAAPFALVTLVVGAGGYALGRSDTPPAAAVTSAPLSNATMPAMPTSPMMADPAGALAPTALPPGHPAIGAASGGAMPPVSAEAADLTWKAPSGWTVAPNPSSMRLATYRVPRAGADKEDADIGITRAGGTTDANIERWLTQFDARGKDTRTESRVHGIKVTVVDVTGTYLGGGMTPGAPSASHPGWALLAAVIEGPGTPYFVKITGPAATVQAARPAFDALVGSFTPS